MLACPAVDFRQPDKSRFPTPTSGTRRRRGEAGGRVSGETGGRWLPPRRGTKLGSLPTCGGAARPHTAPTGTAWRICSPRSEAPSCARPAASCRQSGWWSLEGGGGLWEGRGWGRVLCSSTNRWRSSMPAGPPLAEQCSSLLPAPLPPPPASHPLTLWHEDHHRVRRGLVPLCRVGLLPAQHVARKLDHSNLHDGRGQHAGGYNTWTAVRMGPPVRQ